LARCDRIQSPHSTAAATGNAWVHWCLWAHGGNLVDKNDKVILNSPETAKALEYAKQLYENMITGVAAWNDASNNKGFLGSEISWTDNGISIYVAARREPNLKAIADDMDHALWPIGPVGKPTEFHLMYPLLAMAYMLEADQFNKWLDAAQGYLTHSLNAYDANPVWQAIQSVRYLTKPASAHSRPAGSVRSAKRPQPLFPIFWCSTCSPIIFTVSSDRVAAQRRPACPRRA
jgi:ABC-type glycerol-3-phosphate transport system substrate-binding protein